MKLGVWEGNMRMETSATGVTLPAVCSVLADGFDLPQGNVIWRKALKTHWYKTKQKVNTKYRNKTIERWKLCSNSKRTCLCSILFPYFHLDWNPRPPKNEQQQTNKQNQWCYFAITHIAKQCVLSLALFTLCVQIVALCTCRHSINF